MEYILGEILAFSYNRVPLQTLMCDGRLLKMITNGALYSLLRTAWGGDGHTTFGIPNLAGRVMQGLGQAVDGRGTVVGQSIWEIGSLQGTDSYVISENQLPRHRHDATFTPSGDTAGPAYVQVSSNNGKLADPSGNYLAKTYDGGSSNNNRSYISAADAGTLTNLAGVGGGTGGLVGGMVKLANVGDGKPFVFNNPASGVNFCITTAGVYPRLFEK